MSIDMHVSPVKAQVVQVIFVDAMRGDGSPENPERMIYMYFSLDGQLLACYDPLNGPPDGFIVRAFREAKLGADAPDQPHKEAA
ncbi:MAG TPA: hypothetical protein VJ001_05485 [Rhodocyclaceae bacterium]|nr:hypothetical protein [Rhodocyclaceae bacterium]